MSTTPYYQLSIVAHDVGCEVRLNDVPVLRLPGGHVETRFDVNPYVLGGANRLSLHVREAEDKDSFSPASAVRVSIGVRDSVEAPADSTREVATLAFSAPSEGPIGFEASGEVAVSLRGLVASTTFDLDVPFGPWFWLSSPELEPTEALRTDLLGMYRRMHAMLNARDSAALMQGCALQAGDWQMAYGLPDIDAAQQMLGIAATLADPDVGVEPFPEGVLTLELLGGGRLVQLVDDEGHSPLRLTMKSDADMVGRFNVVLCRSGGGWVIAR